MLELGEYRGKLCMCDWVDNQLSNSIFTRHDRVRSRLNRALHVGYNCYRIKSDVIDEAVKQLDEYFAGQRREFDVPLLLVGTEFQKKVWNGLLDIPYGTTTSYSELAQRLGVPTAYRAVANANAANVLSIFVPCHRVVGKNDSLTGYAGGISAKRLLLELEKINIPR